MVNRDRTAVENGLGDILGGVIERDRRQAGRKDAGPARPASAGAGAKGPRAVEPEAGEGPEMGPVDGNSPPDAHEDGQIAGWQAGMPASQQSGQPASQQASKQARALPGELGKAKGRDNAGDVTRRRADEAKRLAGGPSVNVSVRIPRELNDWLDEYVHRAWPKRIHKQELIVEGLRLLFARRGRAGEPVLATDLLPSEEEP